MIPEFEFIGGIRDETPVPEGVAVGIGDDAAVLSEKFEFLTTDMLVEGVHFRFDLCSAEEVGWRSVVASLSDIAAMGGAPGPYVASLAVGTGLGREEGEAVIEGMRAAAEAVGYGETSLPIGGDMSSSPGPTVLSVALLGKRAGEEAILRSGARPGDRLVLIGRPGLSAAGLEVLEGAAPDLDEAFRERLAEAYRRPRAEVEAGRWLGAEQVPSALIDVSDGLAVDLGHVAEASGVGARVELEKLPIEPALEAFGRSIAEDPRRLAAGGGEDFCLLACVPADRLDELRRRERAADWSCAEIGAIVSEEPNVTFVDKDGRSVDLSSPGYEHFAGGD